LKPGWAHGESVSHAAFFRLPLVHELLVEESIEQYHGEDNEPPTGY
jgi:hypothetical protein